MGSLGFNSPNYQNNQDLVTTIDYNISDRDQLRGRYIYNKNSPIDANAEWPLAARQNKTVLSQTFWIR